MSEIEAKIKEIYSILDTVINNTLLTRDQHLEYQRGLEYLANVALLPYSENKDNLELKSKIDPQQLMTIFKAIDTLISSKTLSRQEHNQLYMSLQFLYKEAEAFLKQDNNSGEINSNLEDSQQNYNISDNSTLEVVSNIM